jgi:tetratricopeptide (TPR) repeat protein
MDTEVFARTARHSSERIAANNFCDCSRQRIPVASRSLNDRVDRSKLSKLLLIGFGVMVGTMVVWLWLSRSPVSRAEAGRDTLACAWYATDRIGYYKAGTQGKVAVAYAEAGDFARAERVIDAIDENEYFTLTFPGPHFHLRRQHAANLIYKSQSWVGVAVAYARGGDRRGALSALSAARQVIDRMESVHDSREPREKIAAAYAELGEDAQALSLTTSRPSLFYPNEEPAAYSHAQLISLAEAYLRLGRAEKAAEMLALAEQAADSISNTSLKSKALAEAATAYVRAERRGKGAELLGRALALTASLRDAEGPTKSMALTKVAEEYAKSGECRRALEVVEAIGVESNREDALRRVTRACAGGESAERREFTSPEVGRALSLIEAGSGEEGLQIIRGFGRVSGNGGELVSAAARLCARGQFGAALEVARAIRADTDADDAPGVTAEEYRAEAVALIAINYAKVGRRTGDEAQQFLNRLLTLIASPRRED